jgi:transposase
MVSGVGGRFDVSDEEWARLWELIPHKELGRTSWHLRAQFNGIMWKYRTGSPWRDVPERYGKWATVYDRFRTWRDDGVWEALFQAVLDDAESRGEIDWRVSVDSTTNRAHQHAAGAVVDEETMTAFVEELDQRKAAQKGGLGRDEEQQIRAIVTRALVGSTAARRQRKIRRWPPPGLSGGGTRPDSPQPSSDGPAAG